MNYKTFACASVLALFVGNAAFASTNLTAGPSSNGTDGATLTSANATNSAGAAWASNVLALNSGTVFDASFNFQITPGTGAVGNGFTFFLSNNTSGLGTNSNNLGFGGGNAAGPASFEVQFNTYPGTHNPLIPGTSTPYSNLVAASSDGWMNISANSYPYAAVDGVNTCGAGNEGAGCLANNTVWTANIQYQNGLLTVTLLDGTKGATPFVFTETGVDPFAVLGSGLFSAGFTASNGSATEAVNITNFSFSVPEPAAIATFGVGLAALGFLLNRRRMA